MNFVPRPFSWDNIPGNDNGILIDFLKQNYSIDWAETAKIEKIDDVKTIILSTEINSLCLKLNDEQTNVSLKIDDGRTGEFTTKMENGMLNIYNIGNPIARVKGLKLQGNIKIEEQKYNAAAKSFREAISLNVGDIGLLLSEVYAIYLNVEYSSNQNDRTYNENIVSIIRRLERAEKLTKKNGNKKDRTYILYFLGYCYYKNRNFDIARKKLEECIELKSEISKKPSTKDLLHRDCRKSLVFQYSSFTV